MKLSKMQTFRKGGPFWLVTAILAMVFMAGCVGPQQRKDPNDPRVIFDSQIDAMLSELLESEKFSTADMAPAAVMPGSLKAGKRFTRLEEIVMDELSMKLRQNHDIYRLSRQNWFEFREGRLESLPLEDGTVDAVTSNCVINLVPDKEVVFREIARVLKPGGRLVISDIVLDGRLPEAVEQDIYAYVGCVSAIVPPWQGIMNSFGRLRFIPMENTLPPAVTMGRSACGHCAGIDPTHLLRCSMMSAR